MLLPATSLLTRPSWRHATFCRVRSRLLSHSSMKYKLSSYHRSDSTNRTYTRSSFQQLCKCHIHKVLLRPCTRIHSQSGGTSSQPSEEPIPNSSSPPPPPPPPPGSQPAGRKRPSGTASSLSEMQLRQQAREAAAARAAPSPPSTAGPRSPRASRMAALDPAAVLPRFQPGVNAGRVPPPGSLPKTPQPVSNRGAAGVSPGAGAGGRGSAGSAAGQVPLGARGVAGRSVQQVMPGTKPGQAAASAEKRRPASTIPSVPIPQNGDLVTGRVVVVRGDYALVELFGLGKGMTGILEQPYVTKATSTPVMTSVLRPGMDIKALVINAAQRIISLSSANLESSPGALARDPDAFLANADAVWLKEYQSKGGTIIAPGKLPPPDSVSTTNTAAPSTSSSSSAASAATNQAPSSSQPAAAPTSSPAVGTTSTPKLKPKGRGSLFGKKRTTSSSSAPPAAPAASPSMKDSDRLLQWKAVEDLCTSAGATRAALMDAVKTMTKLLSGYASPAPDAEKSGILSAVTQWLTVARAHMATFTPSEIAAMAAIWVLLEQKKITSVQDQSMGPVSDKLPVDMASFLAQLAINVQPHLRSVSAHDLATVVGAVGVTIPGRVSVEWLMEAEIASFGSLPVWSGDNLAAVIYSFDQLGTPLKWAPNKTWLDAWLTASEPKLMTMGPRALSRATKGLSGFKHKPSDEWVVKYNMSYQSRMQDMAPEDLANTLIGMAALGIGGMGGQPGMGADGDFGGPGFGGFDPNMPFPNFNEDMFNDFGAGAPDMSGGETGDEDMFGGMGPGGAGGFDGYGEQMERLFDMMKESGIDPENFDQDPGKLFEMMEKSGMNPGDMFGKDGMNGMNSEEMFSPDELRMMDKAGMNPEKMFMDDDDDGMDDILDADFVEAATGRKPPSSGADRGSSGNGNGGGRDRGSTGITQAAEFSDVPQGKQAPDSPPKSPVSS